MTAVLVTLVIIILIRTRVISTYPAIDLYNDMAGGSQRTNPWVGFLQEGQKDMFTKPYYEGSGFNIDDYSIPSYPVDEPDEYDYTKPIDYDYTSELYRS